MRLIFYDKLQLIRYLRVIILLDKQRINLKRIINNKRKSRKKIKVHDKY